jgi:carbonic anhydrase
MKIIKAQTDDHYHQARILFQEYADWLGIDLSFQNFENELKSLEQMYAPPCGALLLAFENDESVGCVGVRSLPAVGDKASEMKRLYVRPHHQGSGIGRRLAEKVLIEAQKLGYNRMLLDTAERLKRAVSLYHSLGFREIEKYYNNPVNNVIYMEKKL